MSVSQGHRSGGELVAEHLTRDVFGKRLGWHDFEFVSPSLNRAMRRRSCRSRWSC